MPIRAIKRIVRDLFGLHHHRARSVAHEDIMRQRGQQD